MTEMNKKPAQSVAEREYEPSMIPVWLDYRILYMYCLLALVDTDELTCNTVIHWLDHASACTSLHPEARGAPKQELTDEKGRLTLVYMYGA